MQRQWTAQELVEHWTLAPNELELLANKAGLTRLSFALALKFFQQAGRFPEGSQEIPTVAVAHVALQVGVPATDLAPAVWSDRTMRYHRAQLREFLGVREATESDVEALTAWLSDDIVPSEHHLERLRAAVLERCRADHLGL